MEILDHQPSTEKYLPGHEPPQPFSFWRNFFVLLGNALLGILLATLLSSVIGVLYGYNITELANVLSGLDDTADTGFIRAILGINQFFTFLAPGFLTAYIIYKQDWWRNLFLKIGPSAKDWGLGIVILLCAIPLVQYSYYLNQLIPLPQSMLDQEEAAKQLIDTILTYNAPYELLINVLLIAILPGIGEEIVFRGILQKNLEWATKNAHLAIWISAFIFSVIHFQFAGFIPRLLLGAVLGYLFYYTQNLWVPIIAHVFNNGIQVLADYFYKEEISSVDIENIDAMPWYAGLTSLILAIFLLWFLKRTNYNRLYNPIAR